MEAGQIAQFEVDDARFWLRMDWGQFKAMLRDVNDAEAREDSVAFIAMLEDMLLTFITRTEGLTVEDTEHDSLDADIGDDRRVIDALAPAQVMAIFEGLTNIAEQLQASAIPPP